MPIPISNYVDITSGIGGASQVPTRNLGALVLSANALIPTGQILNFESAAAVGAYFGTGSGEYARAVFYFGWVSKNITTPQVLSFWFWNADAATGSLIYGIEAAYAVSGFTGITTGDFTLTLGGFTHHLTAINLSAAGSLAAVATDITTAINAYSAGGAAWTGAVVSYDATNQRFDLVSGLAGADTISVLAGASEDLVGPLGWGTGAIFSNGTAAQLLTANLNQLINLSNNFGSICFGPSSFNTLINAEALANWNNSLTPNIQFIASIRTTVANAASWAAALALIGGCTLTLAPGAGELNAPATTEYPEMAPMMILAATNYLNVNSTQNYMYQEFELTASVTTAALQQSYDALNVNYYGQTQTAGQLIQFYQRGVMMGLPVNPSDQNVYANEIWFKDALAAAILNLFLALPQIPTNNAGRAMLIGIIQSIIQQALNNGTIEVGKQLTETQILYISEVTGVNNAWQQVQNVGYWLNVVFQPFTVGDDTEYKAVYTLVYSKDDVVRLVQGSDILI